MLFNIKIVAFYRCDGIICVWKIKFWCLIPRVINIMRIKFQCLIQRVIILMYFNGALFKIQSN